MKGKILHTVLSLFMLLSGTFGLYARNFAFDRNPSEYISSESKDQRLFLSNSRPDADMIAVRTLRQKQNADSMEKKSERNLGIQVCSENNFSLYDLKNLYCIKSGYIRFETEDNVSNNKFKSITLFLQTVL